jgi:hypothetical protein
MAQHQLRPEKATMANIISSQFLDTRTRVEAMLDMQVKFFATLAQLNQEWFDRAKSEARLASELSAKLTTAHSFPDVTAAFREWHSQQLQMITNDCCRFFSESQKLMAMGVRLLGNGKSEATT